ncbi:MAG: hypothetical protein QXU18_01690, partial [Thermoplasmatales archaeon]
MGIRSLLNRISIHILSYALISILIGSYLLAENEEPAQLLGYIAIIFLLLSFVIQFALSGRFDGDSVNLVDTVENTKKKSMKKFIVINLIASVVL